MATAEAIKVKKKNWYEIVAPAVLNKIVVGETYVPEPKEVIGRVLKVNLMTLTDNPKEQSINVRFKVTGFNDGKFDTDVIGYYTMPSSIKRMVRRGRDRIDESFVCKTSDKKTLRLKPILVTKSKTKNSILNALRKEAKRLLTEQTSKKTYEDFLKELLSYKLQNSIKNQLKKIYPLKNFDIKTMETIGGVEQGADMKAESAQQQAEQTAEEQKAEKEIAKEKISEKPEEKGKIAEKEISEKEKITKEEFSKKLEEKEIAKEKIAKKISEKSEERIAKINEKEKTEGVI